MPLTEKPEIIQAVKIVEIEQDTTEGLPSVEITNIEETIEESEQATEIMNVEDEDEEDNTSEDVVETINSEGVDEIEKKPTQILSSFQKKILVRTQQTRRRRQQQLNRKKAKQLLRNDGYYVKKVVLQSFPSIVPALPQVNVTQPYSLVLVTTADVSPNYHTYKIDNVLRMFNLFQRMFNFRGVVFTSSPQIMEMAQKENITFITEISENVHGMPILRDMLVKVKELYESDYYGYINSDILLSFNVFEILEICKLNAEKGVISRRHEIAGRVREIKLYKPLPYDTLDSYLTYLNEASKMKQQFRHKHSADYFIFSRYFNFSSMDPAVIGRERIDNYMLSIPHQRPETEEDQEYMVGTMDSSWKSKGHLLDTSYKIFGLHLGLDGYRTRIRKDHLEKDDILWNNQFIRNYKLAFGSLAFAHYQFPVDYKPVKKPYLKELLNLRKQQSVH